MLNINENIKCISGVGEKRRALLNKLGIDTIKDLLEYFPISYNVIEPSKCIKNAEIGKKQYINLKIVGMSQSYKVTIAKALDGDNQINLKWFNSPFIRSTIKVGSSYVAHGYVKKIKDNYEIIQPQLYTIEEYEAMVGKILPIYSLTKGISNKILSNIINKAILEVGIIEDKLDESIKKKYNLPNYDYVVRILHSPIRDSDISFAKNRLIFEEFFDFVVSMKKIKEDRQINNYKIEEKLNISDLERAIGFSLTNAQKKAINDIILSQNSKYSMSRLLQGDVGCGKTLVAFKSLIDVALNDYQSAMMAPTEILAIQHYEGIKSLINKLNLNIEVVLLSSSISKKNKAMVYDKISSGMAKIIIGTHSIIWKDLIYKNLAYVITDEQHRFGVNQRSGFSSKGKFPHILVMSATPIPRTLAIMLYGNLDVSLIDEMPKNRLSIKNKVVGKEYEKAAYNLIKKEVSAGRQAYVVCPLIEESEGIDCVDLESEYEKLKRFFGDGIKISMLHGRMKNNEKEQIMSDFKLHNIDVLVSTVVVEVGVDVPNATVMVIIDPQRFGLAQLHQLRGRVGRGIHQSYCVLLVLSSENESIPRLEIFEKTNDGFKIASQDLKLRGPGEFFGKKQCGDFQFKYADIYEDIDILHKAIEAAKEYDNVNVSKKQIYNTI